VEGQQCGSVLTLASAGNGVALSKAGKLAAKEGVEFSKWRGVAVGAVTSISDYINLAFNLVPVPTDPVYFNNLP
jgi:hypothetical protein